MLSQKSPIPSPHDFPTHPHPHIGPDHTPEGGTKSFPDQWASLSSDGGLGQSLLAMLSNEELAIFWGKISQ